MDGVELCHQQRVSDQVEGGEGEEGLGQELALLPPDVPQVKHL